MEHVRWLAEPGLRTPVLVAAFAGWNDAGEAATTAVRHLAEVFGATPVATLDPEEFFDFQQTRPHVRLTDGVTREIVWPANEVYSASTPGGDLVLLVGTEPQLRWRTFCGQVMGVAHELDVRQVITLGALLADVPHTRDVQIIGTSSDPGMIARFGLQRSRYEGPTGIVGVLHDACQRAEVPSVSLWAACPAYAQSTPSPKAALALVRAVAGVLGTPVPTADLVEAARTYEAAVDDFVADDDELADYVRRLELLIDGGFDEDDDDEDGDEVVVSPEPSAERLVEEVERFLRDHGDGGRR